LLSPLYHHLLFVPCRVKKKRDSPSASVPMLAQGSKSGQGKLGHAVVAAQGRDVAIERTSRGNPEPGAPLAVPWGPGDSGLAALLAFLAFILSQIVVLPAVGKGENDPTLLALSLLGTLIWQAIIIRLAFWIARRRGGDAKDLGLRRPFEAEGRDRDIGRVLRLVFGGYLVAEVLTVVYGTIASATGLDALQPQRQLPDRLFTDAGLVALTGVAVVLTAPIAEEILFRGMIFAGLNRAWGFWPAAFGSGLLFAVAHAQSGLIIPFTLVGVTLAYVYRRAGSIYASMSVHFLFNCLSFLALLLIPGART
jgi:membrane protease YdiL (CAAX protease family)